MSAILDKYKAAIGSSSDFVLDRSIIVIHGGSLAGKTCVGATLSEQCPPLPNKGMFEITDTAHVGIDRGAADSLPGVGVKFKHYINFQKLVDMCGGNPIEASNVAVQIVAAWPVKNVLVDTLSMFLTHVTTYYEGRPSDFTSNGKYDGQLFFRKVLTTGKAFYSSWSSLPMNVLFLSHTKVDSAQLQGGERAALELRAGSLGGAGKLELDIVGASAKLLTNEASLLIHLEAIQPAIPGGVVTRSLILEDTTQTAQTKNRFGAFTGKREEPNVLKLLNKIRAAIKEKNNQPST